MIQDLAFAKSFLDPRTDCRAKYLPSVGGVWVQPFTLNSEVTDLSPKDITPPLNWSSGS
jgi:hypothetical protein